MKYNEILKELRNEQGLTQKELSKKIGITASAIGFLENGQREPLATTLAAYADYFGVSLDYLMGREDETGALTYEPKSITTKKNPITDRPPSDIVTEKFIDEFKDLFFRKDFPAICAALPRHGSGYPHLCPRVYMQLSQKRRYEYGKCSKIAYYKSFCRMYLLCARLEV